MNRKVVRLLSLALLLVPMASPVLAHPGHGVPGHGLTAGLLHPVLGLDHLLAMVAVGVMSAQLGGRALGAVPAAFVVSMLLGGVAGFRGVALPGVEWGVAASVLVAGVVLMRGRRGSLATAFALTALFGFLHGQAHALEAPRLSSVTFYSAGFMMTTVVLQLCGVGLGCLVLRARQGHQRLQWSGAALAVAGLAILWTCSTL